MRVICKVLVVALLAVAVVMPVEIASSAAANDVGSMLKVGILTKQVNVIIENAVPYKLQDVTTGKVIAVFAANEKAMISRDKAFLTVNGIKTTATTMKILVNSHDASRNFTVVNHRHYRGVITVKCAKDRGMTVIDTLGAEEYLYGVIAREISPDWPMEALKAQAVAARSFLLANMDKHKAEGFNICATTDCQSYGGYDAEQERTRQAVDSTRGEIMTYKGKAISANFNTSAGGYTENSENVWGMYQPYLRGVPDYDQQSPYFKWEKEIAPTELNKILTQAGYKIGTLQAIHLSKLTAPPVLQDDRGVSGRIRTIQFVGNAGAVELNGQKLRSLLSLKSTLFDIDVVVNTKKVLDFPITDNAGDRANKHVEVNLPPHHEQGLVTDGASVRRITGRADEMLIITGYGWGHGIGMSQWGAKAMAEKAPKKDSKYYQKILRHYYQGIEFQKVY